MARFILYTYQFAPLLKVNLSLFDKVSNNPEERMLKKQDYLQDILSNPNFKFQSSKKEMLDHQIRHNKNRIIIFKLANNKHLNLEENFKKKKHNYYPSCFVIIDNRDNMQHIAIEENPTSFDSTDVTKNILEYSLQKALKGFGLTISIKKEYEQAEFWNLIKRYPRGVAMIRFHFSYPNLPRVSDSINQLISSQSKLTNSKETTFELKSSAEEVLNITPENQQLNGLVDASAKSGNNIVLRMKGYRKHLHTGETTKNIEVADFEYLIDGEDLFENTHAKIIKMLNDLKQ